MSQFFTEQKLQFFKPLNGKYRGQIVDCLSTFYQRLYGSLADYSRSFNREQVIEILEEGIARSPVLEDDASDEFTVPVKNQREQANWVLNQLLEHGWLERHMDEATLHSTYAFSRYGRLFTQPMVEASGGKFRTRHRNTRNTRNALQSFINNGEVHDLLDAFEYSERIISDFSDVIAELEERKRQLVKEVEAQQVVQRASDEFFDFMEQRFMPDLAIRLSADSVEKYRDEISELIAKARRKHKTFKTKAEKDLRRAAPELIVVHDDSVYLMILDGIETRMHSASIIMLPALREALNNFTRRADIIIRQLSYAGTGVRVHLYALCNKLKKASEHVQANALEETGKALASLNVGFVDTDNLRIHAERKQRLMDSSIDEHKDNDQHSRKEIFVQTAVDLAFVFNSKTQREYLINALADGHRIHSQNLPIKDARDLLMSAHMIEVGGASSSEFAFKVEASGNRVKTDYFDLTDEFTIELIERGSLNHAD
ncbi:MAG: DUF5716 family protein [Gammaproteobacteria bacterium]|nr:DUF5716 family protein [Gammaproteobacteria bacterium]